MRKLIYRIYERKNGFYIKWSNFYIKLFGKIYGIWEDEVLTWKIYVNKNGSKTGVLYNVMFVTIEDAEKFITSCERIGVNIIKHNKMAKKYINELNKDKQVKEIL